MTKKQNKVLKIFEGNKPVGDHRPILVVLADTSQKGYPFGQHFLFLGMTKSKFAHQAIDYSLEESNGAHTDLGGFPDLFSLEEVFAYQFARARDHLEYTVHQENSALSRDIFWAGYEFKFIETTDEPLIRFKVFGLHIDDLREMFELSRSDASDSLEKRLKAVPKVRVKVEPAFPSLPT